MVFHHVLFDTHKHAKMRDSGQSTGQVPLGRHFLGESQVRSMQMSDCSIFVSPHCCHRHLRLIFEGKDQFSIKNGQNNKIPFW